MYHIEYHTENRGFTRDRWEMVITGMGYNDSLFKTIEDAQTKIGKLSVAYEEPESKYRIVEDK